MLAYLMGIKASHNRAKILEMFCMYLITTWAWPKGPIRQVELLDTKGAKENG